MTAVLRMPSTFNCPKCHRSTLIHRSFYKRFECTHIEGSKPCGYQEPEDSASAILRVIEYNLSQAEFKDDNIQIAIELSKIHNAVKNLLTNIDTWKQEEDEG